MKQTDIYPQPKELPRSPRFRVFVDDVEVPVLHAVDTAVATFGTDGPVDVRIETLWEQAHHAI